MTKYFNFKGVFFTNKNTVIYTTCLCLFVVSPSFSRAHLFLSEDPFSQALLSIVNSLLPQTNKIMHRKKLQTIFIYVFSNYID